MIKQFWPKHVTQQNWNKLKKLTKEFDFVLIGGWAVYLYTGLHKSKDIDILVSLDTLYSIKSNYELKKNIHLKKYEIEEQGFDIDIYVPYFSNLAIPVEDIVNMKNIKIKGINIVKPEILLILKQSAFIDRKGSVKGDKDAADIIALARFADINLQLYYDYLLKYNHKDYWQNLKHLVTTFDNIEYTGMVFPEFNKWKKKFLKLMQ